MRFLRFHFMVGEELCENVFSLVAFCDNASARRGPRVAVGFVSNRLAQLFPNRSLLQITVSNEKGKVAFVAMRAAAADDRIRARLIE